MFVAHEIPKQVWDCLAERYSEKPDLLPELVSG